ncbi:CopM family metallochaperone [Klebsiella michiganensis]|uniref:CopM family metallochaperone n=1 Tax=Klebsiella michiganensis TaxID=1134687 RepID=UPI0025A2C0A0|nr:DUF305 domain-containing protein [Klebsiella michiganensis]MDM6775966.1 DUF305 domain-containing protein [Klebsiella michiganensis]HDT0414667.1 DUF305 domain-containing protein [Klebsiella michiganensis]
MKKCITTLLITGVWSVNTIAMVLPPAQASAMHRQLKLSMEVMHKEMSKGVASNDADIAFAAGMVPHHQGAVDMAHIELKYGKDPEMQALAKEIITSQNTQINEMNQWLIMKN